MVHTTLCSDCFVRIDCQTSWLIPMSAPNLEDANNQRLPFVLAAYLPQSNVDLPWMKQERKYLLLLATPNA